MWFCGACRGLPDSLVGLIPNFHDVLPETDQDSLHFSVDVPASERILRRRVDYFVMAKVWKTRRSTVTTASSR